MRVLVIGSGGREHALVWKLAQSKLIDKIFCAPGNGGVSEQAECIDINAEDTFKLLEFAQREKIDLTVVGPELPLAGGISDEFRNYKLKVFGPVRKAARLEASKVFAKELMLKYGVPTAGFKVFDNAQEAKKYAAGKGAPLVIKADGLCQGKGVVVADSVEEAQWAIDSMMQEKAFGEAGARIIIEDCLRGEEVSIIVLTDSKEVIPLASSQDHKRVFDGDRGANTGGMGAYSPAPVVREDLFRSIQEQVIYRMLDGLNREGIDYQGVLYAGIMVTQQGPKVLEFNVRLGDPETQAILPRLKTDLLELMLATTERRLGSFKKIDWDARACVCVVLASGGYPGNYEKGKEISGLAEANKMQDVTVFHAGTKKLPVVGSQSSDKYVTNGGRVLGVTGLGQGIKAAIEKTYKAVEKINFDGMQYRKDIGFRALKTVDSSRCG